MADRAQVKSVEAIESFRSELIIFLSKARPALEEMAGEVLRARHWLQHDQRRLWEGEMKARRKKFERAQAELFTVSMSKFQEVSSAQQLIMHKAKAACEEADKKIALLRKWDKELDNRAEPLVKQVDQFQSFVTSELPKAIAYLGQVIQSLEAYAEVGLGGASGGGALPKIEEPPPESSAPQNTEEKNS
jgi:hypothetical protein